MEIPKELARLSEAFPGGYVSTDWSFVLDSKSQVSIPLEPIETEQDTAQLVVAFASEQAYMGRVSPWFWKNWAYRARLRAGISKILRGTFTKADFGLMSFLLGECHNLSLAKTFVAYGANMSVLRRYLKDQGLADDFEQFRNEHKLTYKLKMG